MNTLRIIIFLVLSLNSLAYEINSKLELVEGSAKWTEGETRKAKLTIWPIEEIDSDYINKELLGKDLVDHFFVSKIISSSFSKNNPTAYEVVMNITLKNYFNQRKPLLLSYKALNIPVTLSGIEIFEDKNRIKEYLVIDANSGALVEGIKINWMIVFVTLIVLLPLGYFGIKQFRKIKAKKIELQNKQRWKDVIVKTNSREEVEDLYKMREEWMPVYGGNNPQFQNLLNIIDKHQYKKEWNTEINSEIDFILEEIKDSL